MRRLCVTFDGGICGELSLREEGLYLCARARCTLPGGALYRLFLVGERGELSLGVLAPDDGALSVSRRLPCARTGPLGALVEGQARRSFYLDGAPRWAPLERPFFRDAALERALGVAEGALSRREGTLRALALPLREGRAFPLAQCFCFARVETLDGQECAVYRFDARDLPVF